MKQLCHKGFFPLSRPKRRAPERRWRKERQRAVPSQSPAFRYLAAFSPDKSGLRFAQRRSPQQEATLEQDASLVEMYNMLTGNHLLIYNTADKVDAA